MPTATTAGDGAAAAAAAVEARQWHAIAEAWTRDRRPGLWADLPPREVAVVGLADPAEDLDRRASSWGYVLGDDGLGAVAEFAAALARTESEAWRDRSLDVATKAYADRRFLIGDRVIAWAAPWLDVVGRCHPELRSEAQGHRDVILAIGDIHRPSPALAGPEGLGAPGEDAYGPASDLPSTPNLGSLAAGALVLRTTLEAITSEERTSRELGASELTDGAVRAWLATYHEVAAARWRRWAVDHPGTGRIWLDLSARADLTAQWLAGGTRSDDPMR